MCHYMGAVSVLSIVQHCSMCLQSFERKRDHSPYLFSVTLLRLLTSTALPAGNHPSSTGFCKVASLPSSFALQLSSNSAERLEALYPVGVWLHGPSVHVSSISYVVNNMD